MDEIVIKKGDQAYMWLVIDEDTHEQWLFYDGENARKFLKEKEEETGHWITHGTLPIMDLK